jgi:hypothetical protein
MAPANPGPTDAVAGLKSLVRRLGPDEVRKLVDVLAD